jgi:hypothetical protein
MLNKEGPYGAVEIVFGLISNKTLDLRNLPMPVLIRNNLDIVLVNFDITSLVLIELNPGQIPCEQVKQHLSSINPNFDICNNSIIRRRFCQLNLLQLSKAIR